MFCKVKKIYEFLFNWKYLKKLLPRMVIHLIIF